MGDNWDELSVYGIVQVGSGGTSGMITDGSEILGLDNLEFEVVGWTCGTADRCGGSEYGSND